MKETEWLIWFHSISFDLLVYLFIFVQIFFIVSDSIYFCQFINIEKCIDVDTCARRDNNLFSTLLFSFVCGQLEATPSWARTRCTWHRKYPGAVVESIVSHCFTFANGKLEITASETTETRVTQILQDR